MIIVWFLKFSFSCTVCESDSILQWGESKKVENARWQLRIPLLIVIRIKFSRRIHRCHFQQRPTLSSSNKQRAGRCMLPTPHIATMREGLRKNRPGKERRREKKWHPADVGMLHNVILLCSVLEHWSLYEFTNGFSAYIHLSHFLASSTYCSFVRLECWFVSFFVARVMRIAWVALSCIDHVVLIWSK